MLCLLALLSACVQTPADVVAKIKIIPATPGDDIELYLGTNARPGHLSEIAADQLAIDQVQAYAVDQIKPHLVLPADYETYISDSEATLGAVIAFEDHATYAAAATIDLSADPAPTYMLQLQAIGAASGLDAVEWGPTDPTDGEASNECAYYNGPDADDKQLEVALVVDTDTATTVTPYVDLDCDGYHASTDGQTLECNDRVYDSMGQAGDDSTCVAPYPAENDDCLVVGQACNDGTPTPTGCPDTITAQNLTKWCVPTGYCDDPSSIASSLADMIAKPSMTAGEISCDVEIDPRDGQPCAPTVTATGSPDLVLCGGMQAIDVEIGAGGPPYGMDAIMPNTMDATVSVSQSSVPCTLAFSFSGDWSALAGDVTTTTTLMLAVTPSGSARGFVLPVSFTTTAIRMGQTCMDSPPACAVMLPTAAADQSLSACLNAP